MKGAGEARLGYGFGASHAASRRLGLLPRHDKARQPVDEIGEAFLVAFQGGHLAALGADLVRKLGQHLATRLGFARELLPLATLARFDVGKVRRLRSRASPESRCSSLRFLRRLSISRAWARHT